MGFLYCYIEHGSMDLVIKIPYFFDSFNGLRYLRWGGDGEAVRFDNCPSVDKA